MLAITTSFNTSISTYLMDGTHLAQIVIYILLALIGIYIVSQIVCYFFFRQNYHGVKFTTRNIATIAVMAALSATVTIVISMTIPITVFPPIRIGFEGIMIKIAGMFFGPMIGILVGLITELMTILFVPSYIHIAYLMVAIGFGFLAGIAAYTKRWAGTNKRWITFGIINVFIVAYGVIMVLITSSYSGTVKFFGAEITQALYKYVFIAILAATLVVIWAVIFSLKYFKKMKAIDTILPIILLCVVTEFLITTLIGSWGDKGFLGIPETADGYTSILVLRLLESPFKVLINTFILSSVYYVLKPLVKRD